MGRVDEVVMVMYNDERGAAGSAGQEPHTRIVVRRRRDGREENETTRSWWEEPSI